MGNLQNHLAIIAFIHLSYSIVELEAPPPLPGRHPTPPSTSSPQTTELESTQVQNTGELCSFGSNSSDASSSYEYTVKGSLYVDFENPATCSGSVKRWEICYIATGDDTIDFGILQYNQTGRNYQIVGENILAISVSDTPESGNVLCEYIEAEAGNAMHIEEGDYLGFVCRGSIQVALGNVSPGKTSSLRIHDFASTGTRRKSEERRQVKRNSPLFEIRSLQEDDFRSGDQGYTPLIRVIIDTTVTSTMEVTTRCGNGGGDDDLFNSFTFIAVVAVAIVIIFVLFIVIFCMGCCLCEPKCCKFLSRCCKKRQRVNHTVRVEPLNFDRSMQYNDMYVPNDPTQMISQGKKITTEFRPNPSYDGQIDLAALRQQQQQQETPRAVASPYETETEKDNSMGTTEKNLSQNCLIDDGDNETELEHTYEMMHTYEMIESLKK